MHSPPVKHMPKPTRDEKGLHFDLHIVNYPIRVFWTLRAIRKMDAEWGLEGNRSTITINAETRANGLQPVCALNNNYFGDVQADRKANLPLDTIIQHDVEFWRHRMDGYERKGPFSTRSIGPFEPHPVYRAGDTVKRFTASYLMGMFVADEKLQFDHELPDTDDEVLRLYIDIEPSEELCREDAAAYAKPPHSDELEAVRRKYLKCAFRLSIQQPSDWRPRRSSRLSKRKYRDSSPAQRGRGKSKRQ